MSNSFGTFIPSFSSADNSLRQFATAVKNASYSLGTFSVQISGIYSSAACTFTDTTEEIEEIWFNLTCMNNHDYSKEGVDGIFEHCPFCSAEVKKFQTERVTFQSA